MTRRGTPRRRRAARASALTAVVAALLAGVTACGVPDDTGFRPVAADEVQFGLADPTTTTSSTVPATTTSTVAPAPETATTVAQLVELYLVSGFTVVPVQRSVPPPVTLEEVARLLVAGPQPGDPVGVRTLVSDGLVLDVELRGGVATVDLSAAFLDQQLPSTQQQLMVAQLVYTMTAQPGVGQVLFSIDGQPIAVPRADGSVAEGPISADAYRAVPSTTTTVPAPSSVPPAEGPAAASTTAAVTTVPAGS